MKEKFHPRAHQQPSKVTGCFQLAPVNYPKNQEWLPSKKNFFYPETWKGFLLICISA